MSGDCLEMLLEAATGSISRRSFDASLDGRATPEHPIPPTVEANFIGGSDLSARSVCQPAALGYARRVRCSLPHRGRTATPGLGSAQP